jgi:phosphoribosylformimino-5-aminoimidazole carboxamide ribotide isomerase
VQTARADLESGARRVPDGCNAMEILPAIDLLGGKCVRLVQGRYDRVIQYEAEPLETAERFRNAGAEWLHVIDLEGAREGKIENLAVLQSIVSRTGLNVEFGGGVRCEESIQAALDSGAKRVIVGTRALEDPEWFARVVQRSEYAGRLALGLDARLGKLCVRGWTRATQREATEVAASAAGWPLASIVYTDIGHDGMLLGPSIEAIERMLAASSVPVIAAGGVSDIEDVRRLRATGLAGVVIGRAIYESTVDLAEALRLARGEAPPAEG